jgi:hypothetical protein
LWLTIQRHAGDPHAGWHATPAESVVAQCQESNRLECVGRLILFGVFK